MPNKPHRNKRGGSRFPAMDRSKPFRKTHSVKELLGRVSPTLTRVSDQGNRQSFWRQWLHEQLPPALCQRVSGIVEREGTLVIFAESAAWSARLRYAVQDLEARIRAARPGIQQVAVRVLPKA